MFCRFGSLELSRPVAATDWLNEACTRPVAGWINCGSASTYVFFNFAYWRYSMIFAGNSMLPSKLFQHVGVGAGAGFDSPQPRQL